MTDSKINVETRPLWAGSPTCRQVASMEVYNLVSPLLGDPGLIPGTPVWCQLDDGDPAKWQAILWAAVWWAVDQDARQAAMAEASRAVSASPNWRTRPRGASYIPRRKEIA